MILYKKQTENQGKITMLYVLAVLVAYLLGSVPFGLVLTRIMGRGDLRQVGSGNIGAANVMRVGGLRMAGVVWLLDMAKAVAAVLIGNVVGGGVFGALCGFFAVLGHCFPIWLKFKGGKGVSCLFGILLAIKPMLFVICGLLWLLIAIITKYSSAGALAVFCLLPVLGFFTDFNLGIAFVAIALLCLWQHRANIIRLLSGKESKIEWKWKK